MENRKIARFFSFPAVRRFDRLTDRMRVVAEPMVTEPVIAEPVEAPKHGH